ncbi:hypothetical protein PY092_14465 [Muricauda sp. 334s03]|uniref:DUF4252 domain-containing protein n=1 Tax=Flagellimonas yonaguniensis TaxID=3031325 RepID=A0ABT5Y1N3_9FLAO|nr:hypothetical protein [[Muricauda] yonaguniensis]MDF0717364.1 hypothetical protein [[Muricauda] yonaguniensis]
MKSKIFSISLMGFSFLILCLGCGTPNKSKNDHFNGKDTLAELDRLLMQLDQMDASDCGNLDEIVTINEKMRRMVENIRSSKAFDSIAKAFDANTNQIDFVVSKDEQFGVFSWYTKMDCLGNSIKNIALYKSDNKVLASSLYGKSMIYHEIKSRKQTEDKTVYLLLGSSSENQDATDSTAKGYKITNGYLAESQIPLPDEAYVNNTPL